MKVWTYCSSSHDVWVEAGGGSSLPEGRIPILKPARTVSCAQCAHAGSVLANKTILDVVEAIDQRADT